MAITVGVSFNPDPIGVTFAGDAFESHEFLEGIPWWMLGWWMLVDEKK